MQKWRPFNPFYQILGLLEDFFCKGMSTCSFTVGWRGEEHLPKQRGWREGEFKCHVLSCLTSNLLLFFFRPFLYLQQESCTSEKVQSPQKNLANGRHWISPRVRIEEKNQKVLELISAFFHFLNSYSWDLSSASIQWLKRCAHGPIRGLGTNKPETCFPHRRFFLTIS